MMAPATPKPFLRRLLSSNALLPTHFLLGALLLLHLTPPGALACTPLEGVTYPRPQEVKVYYSEAVVSGMALERYDDPQIDTAYSIDFRVDCIYKGEVPRNIRIDHAGIVPGLCHSTNLTVGTPYLVYLDKVSDGVYRPTGAQEPGTSAYLEEVAAVCTVVVSYPEGVNPDSPRFKCPDNYPDPTDCIPLPTEATEPPMPPTPPEPQTPPPPPGQRKDVANDGAAYNSVAEEGKAEASAEEGSNDKDAASSLVWGWSLVLAFLSSLTLLL